MLVKPDTTISNWVYIDNKLIVNFNKLSIAEINPEFVYLSVNDLPGARNGAQDIENILFSCLIKETLQIFIISVNFELS